MPGKCLKTRVFHFSSEMLSLPARRVNQQVTPYELLWTSLEFTRCDYSPTSSASAPNVSVCSPSCKHCHFWGHSCFAAVGLMAPVLWEVLGLSESPGIPFSSRKCCFIHTKTYRWRSWLNGGDFKPFACTGEWSISFLSDPRFRLCFSRHGGAQCLEHSHPLQTRALSSGVLVLLCYPWVPKLIPEFINSASQPDCCWPSQPELSMLQIAMYQYG